MRQLSYNTAPLRFSDHRPVYADFQCTIQVVDEALKDEISRKLYEKRRSEVGEGGARTELDDSDDSDDNTGYDSIAPGLPPASSDRRKWWLDNGGAIPLHVSYLAKLGQGSPLDRPSKPLEKITC